jgi:hypothetical protein
VCFEEITGIEDGPLLQLVYTVDGEELAENTSRRTMMWAAGSSCILDASNASVDETIYNAQKGLWYVMLLLLSFLSVVLLGFLTLEVKRMPS